MWEAEKAQPGCWPWPLGWMDAWMIGWEALSANRNAVSSSELPNTHDKSVLEISRPQQLKWGGKKGFCRNPWTQKGNGVQKRTAPGAQGRNADASGVCEGGGVKERLENGKGAQRQPSAGFPALSHIPFQEPWLKIVGSRQLRWSSVNLQSSPLATRRQKRFDPAHFLAHWVV